MKPSLNVRCGRAFGSSQGAMLMECLIYIAVFFVVATLAYGAFHRADFEMRAMDRNVDDIVHAVKAGEQWRADIRLATSPPRLEDGVMKLSTKAGDIVYTVRESVLWRQSGGKALPVLERVKSSLMQPESRQHVTAWRWELEMQTKRAQASVRPLFTFLAVPGSEVRP